MSMQSSIRFILASPLMVGTLKALPNAATYIKSIKRLGQPVSSQTSTREPTVQFPGASEGSNSTRITSSVSDDHIRTNSIISDNLDSNDTSRTAEYVTIKKVLRPLHQDDLLYAAKADGSDGMETGAFRSLSSKIWDPHPEYIFDAFGTTMHLKLWHDREFIPKDLKVTHFWHNEALRKPEDHDEASLLQGCYYTGSVVGDTKSSVRVSLCEGMHGYIQTSNGSYLINPEKNSSDNDTNILHRIQRLMTDTLSSGSNVRTTVDGTGTPAEDCAVRTDHEAGKRLYSPNPTDYFFLSRLMRPKRSLNHYSNNEYIMEVMVVVDNKMQRYHGRHLKSYVLTLMSIVSSVYADASIGNSIKIAVSHIMYIHHDLDAQNRSNWKGLEGVSASNMLQDFCKFKQTTNFVHDVALLLTREQICRNPEENNCDTLGLAELGTICGKTACAIVQDNGLSASFTIAHELGHVLGMPHDDDNRCQRYRGTLHGNNRIMSRTIDHNTHPWQWSNCSRQILTEYLENNPDNCMQNVAQNDLLAPTEMDSKLAGEKFTNNAQCELVFGNGSKICSYMPVCNRLWCSWEDEMSGCKTQHMPWADGTECNEGHWCQKGECVPINRTALKPQNGGWNVWSQYSACSRSCGGGVQKRTRECDSPKPKNGGKFCIGLRVEIHPCNTEPCEDPRHNFRDEQCHELDGQNFDVPSLEPNVRWIPKYGTPLADQCKLYCRVQDKSMYFLLREKVIDGTPCTFPEDSFDMCINGQCRKAGCDYVLNSDAKLDQCGVCKGDNSTCDKVSGHLPPEKHSNSLKLSHDKPREFIVPEGSTNVHIIHVGYRKETVYLSLRSETEIIFNDPSKLTSHTSKHRLFAGVRLEYTAHGNQERVTSTFGRPLREKLIVRLVDKSNNDKYSNSQVNYNYMVPVDPSVSKYEVESYQHDYRVKHRTDHNSNTIQRPPETQYRWEMTQRMKCDQLCSGKTRLTAVCVNADTMQEVSSDNCHQSTKPKDESAPCNTDCKFYWEPGRPECSSACGEGFKQIDYKCVRQYHSKQRPDYVDQSLCSNLPKPVNTPEPCTGPCKDATWMFSAWNKCSCTNTTQYRTAKCYSEPNPDRHFQIDDRYCEAKEAKEVMRNCSADELECPRWNLGEPTPCSVTCGEGQQAYALQCMLRNVSVNAALCGTRPVTVIVNCTMPSCERKTMPNTQYSSYRNAVQPNQSMKKVNYAPNPEPSPAPRGHWRNGSFSDCSAECKGGFKKRVVRCVSETGQTLDDRYCPLPKPATQVKCGNLRCPLWTFGQWSECTDECIRSRQVLCQDHRGKESDQCSMEMKPAAVESCCNFKWITTCSGSCDADGRRTPKLICKRLLPKSKDNEKPIKNGRKVDNKYCANAKPPTPSKLKGKCNKPCPFRWDTSPWSKCSVGCGSGRTVRNVTCTNGRTISPKACDMTLKPPNTKVCEVLTHCQWRTRWNKCNCKGKQNRTVKCYDGLLNIESNRCPEKTRPRKYIPCKPPAHCYASSCREVLRKHRTDGEYLLNVNGTMVKIYCHDMATGSPKEYLTLPSGPSENYAIYINRRAAEANKCKSKRADWVDESISYGATHYRKIRLHLATLQVQTNDYHFTSGSGKKQLFGSAGDCYSNTGRCPKGEFSINLEGTSFRIRPSTKWDKDGENAVIDHLIKLQYPYKKVRARCGGYCGKCFVSRGTDLYLELAPVSG
ncbi:A disintegrin and metalloproteinase with thrombospondin motifs 9 [Anopheles nili]|uniref:A disintegrin and metalloproteinase with thrombospondin motifs 9 n=1 Tax=Anopheles nili TaxID=185578 RepID=UPI00237B22F0|nr:A disintegrin and metalloproteinase with thrombospondin motifs 9 [Anopheles nili]